MAAVRDLNPFKRFSRAVAGRIFRQDAARDPDTRERAAPSPGLPQWLPPAAPIQPPGRSQLRLPIGPLHVRAYS